MLWPAALPHSPFSDWSPEPTRQRSRSGTKASSSTTTPDREGGDATACRRDHPGVSRTARRQGPDRTRWSSTMRTSARRAAGLGGRLPRSSLERPSAGLCSSSGRACRMTRALWAARNGLPLAAHHFTHLTASADPMAGDLHVGSDRCRCCQGAPPLSYQGRDGARGRKPRMPEPLPGSARHANARPMRGLRRCGGRASRTGIRYAMPGRLPRWRSREGSGALLRRCLTIIWRSTVVSTRFGCASSLILTPQVPPIAPAEVNSAG